MEIFKFEYNYYFHPIQEFKPTINILLKVKLGKLNTPPVVIFFYTLHIFWF